MASTVMDVMTPHPTALEAKATAMEAATAMRDQDTGDVLVVKGGKVCGIVTDRDIVVRAIAEGKDPSSVSLSEICSAELTTLEPGDDIDKAVQLMRRHAVRRLPVVDKGKPVGVVSLGDLAMERDPNSVLADISAARGNS